MITSELKQRRDAIKRKINSNPTKIVISRKPMVDDGFGGQVENPFGIPVESTIKCRISHERSQSLSQNNNVPVGLSTNLSRFIETDYQNVIYENETFEAIGKSWRIGPVDPLWASGGITGYHAPLTEAASASA